MYKPNRICVQERSKYAEIFFLNLLRKAKKKKVFWKVWHNVIDNKKILEESLTRLFMQYQIERTNYSTWKKNHIERFRESENAQYFGNIVQHLPITRNLSYTRNILKYLSSEDSYLNIKVGEIFTNKYAKCSPKKATKYTDI